MLSYIHIVDTYILSVSANTSLSCELPSGGPNYPCKKHPTTSLYFELIHVIILEITSFLCLLLYMYVCICMYEHSTPYQEQASRVANILAEMNAVAYFYVI